MLYLLANLRECFGPLRLFEYVTFRSGGALITSMLLVIFLGPWTIRRLKKAGLIYDAHIMTGVAGHGRGRENAEALAEFFNRTQPRHIVNFSLFLHKDVSLYEEIKNGRFVPADELENLQEERRLLELLEEAQEIRYDGLHDFLEIRVRGILPREKEKMLEKLDRAIAEEKGKGIEAWVEGMPVP